ncbi:MAG: substrate-binding domain-containing protein, partial [Clostridiales Family XIII bacterium]|nr:substrate-binding domain-containing protein [Clostridiales Family XIII bacterium]
MKVLSSTAASLIAVLTLICCVFAGCSDKFFSSDNDSPNSIKVGVALYDEFDTFIGVLFDRFSKIARETEQERGIVIDISVEAANGNQFLQNNQVEAFIESGCDVICVNLVDRTDAAIIIDKANAADIPVIFFNRELVAKDLYRARNLYYVG